jgi:hypothetical protein
MGVETIDSRCTVVDKAVTVPTVTVPTLASEASAEFYRTLRSQAAKDGRVNPAFSGPLLPAATGGATAETAEAWLLRAGGALARMGAVGLAATALVALPKRKESEAAQTCQSEELLPPAAFSCFHLWAQAAWECAKNFRHGTRVYNECIAAADVAYEECIRQHDE